MTSSTKESGAGIDLVVSQYGPVLAQVTAPVGIPLDGGALGGILLATATGGITFGGDPFPDPQSPLDILSDPRFQTDFPVNTDTIRSHVEPAVQAHELTWDRGFTVALKGTLTYTLAPGVITGDVTVGFNVGLVPGQQGLKIIGKGDLDAFGMPFASAALLIDLHDLLAPKFDFAFATPQIGSPLGFLLPAQATFAASLDTKGAVAGLGLGVRVFLQDVVNGGLQVGQAEFGAALDTAAARLQSDHTRPLAQFVLDTNGDGTVSAQEGAQVITRQFLIDRSLALLAVGGNGLPVDATRAARVVSALATNSSPASTRARKTPSTS